MRNFIALITLILGLIAIAPVLAQQNLDPSDNWCFDGGPLAGTCTTDDPAQTNWLWLYGFFRAQVSKGALSVSDVPEEYQIGLVDSASQRTGVIRDGDGNVVAGTSKNFVGSISTCRFTNSKLFIEVAWVGLDIAGDRIEISTEEGSVSKDMYVPLSASEVQFELGGPEEEITEGGTMSVYYRGVLIGRTDDMNGLFNCEDDT